MILCRIQDRRPSKVSVEYRGNKYLVDLTAIAGIDGADVGQPSTRLGDQEIVRRDRGDCENDWGVHSCWNIAVIALKYSHS